jgi:hypothetical protein
MKTATAAALIALAVPAAATAQTTPSSQTSTATLHVVGNGRVFVKPDMATVTINVDRQAPTRVLARTRTDVVVNHIVSDLVGIGLSRPSIQTSNEMLSTTTIHLRHHHHRTVYDVEIDLTVTTDQVSLLSALFAAAARDGADSFQGPNFGFSDPSTGLAQADAAALTDARTRANAAATALGLSVVGVQSIDLDPGSPVPPLPAASAPVKAGGGATRPVSAPTLPGLQEVDATVDVVFLLGPATPATT